MSLDPNKLYHLVDEHSGKGLSCEVYSNYDYIREVEGAGASFKFEPVEGNYGIYRIQMTGYHWDNYTYLTRSGNDWIYLDKKEKATLWNVERAFEEGLTGIWEKEKGRTTNWRYYDKGSKKWLGTGVDTQDVRSPVKKFKIIAAG